MKNVSFPSTDEGRREWIKARLKLAGYTLGGLARELGLSRTASQRALWRSYPRMERIIAEKLGLSPQEIWPERYEARRRRRVCMHADNVITDPSPSGGRP